MVTIGAGGGSIAKVDGRHADRRPAKRRRRSRARRATAAAASEPTVTDAHVVLGHLPAKLLGGRMALDVDAGGARDRAARSPTPLGLDRARGGARHPGDPRPQHGGRGPHRLGRARPRSARLHPGAVRRRRPAAWLRARRRCSASAACWCRPRPACSAPTDCWPPTSRPSSAARCPRPAPSTSTMARKIFAELTAQADDWLTAEKVAPARPPAEQGRDAALSRPGRRGRCPLGRRRGRRRGCLRCGPQGPLRLHARLGRSSW